MSDAVDAYLTATRIRCSARTIELEEERLSIVKKHFGDMPLSAITAVAIADFQRARHDAGIANRTINMDVGVLSRVLKFCGRWRALADHVKNLPERQRPSVDKRRAAAAVRRCRLESRMGARVLRRYRRRRSKNETSHRVIPLNASAIDAVARMLERADLLGHTEPEHYPACQWGRYDPTTPMLQWDTAWRALRDGAGLHGLRFHDLRHTVITELAEMGVPITCSNRSADTGHAGCWSTTRTSASTPNARR